MDVVHYDVTRAPTLAEDELKEIGGQVQLLPRTVESTQVLFNNNYEDQGQRGARALSDMRSSG